MALTPTAGSDSVAMQALDRFEERIGAHLDRVELRTRIWTFVIVLAVQGAATGYLAFALR